MSWSVSGYTEVKELGRGASGRVVLAEHQTTGTKVAIKYLAEHLAHDPEFVTAFRAEARILSEVENPQIARLYEYIETHQGSAIVMELVDGVALRAILREHGPTEPQSALLVLKGSLLGLAATHGRGIVHRDYKPENVLVDREGQSKLADFGIAARTGLRGAHAGTPSYMAPEQWAGAAASPSTDIYAATATFFECLVGHPPYRSPGNIIGLRAMHEESPIPADEVPEPVRGLVRRGLAKRPEQRPRDAATFLVELEAVAGAGYGPEWEEEGRGALARRAALLLLLFPLAGAAAGGSGVAKTILGWSRRSFYTVVGAAAALALATGVGAVAYQTTQHNSSSPPAVSTSPSASSTVAGVVIGPTGSPVVTITPDPTASPSPSSSTTNPGTSPSPPRPPSPSPSMSPPPSPRVLSWSAPTSQGDFCWLNADFKCVGLAQYNGRQVWANVHFAFTTQTTAGFTLTLRFTEIAPGAGRAALAEHTETVQVPAGTTNHNFNRRVDLARLIQCNSNDSARIMLTVTASIPAPALKPVYVSDYYNCSIG